MTQKDKEEEIFDEGFKEIQKEIREIKDIENHMQNDIIAENNEIIKLKETIARMQADNQNFKMRVEREKGNTIFFLKNDILKKILPRIDDLERIVKNTSQENQTGSLYEGVISIEKALKKDLENLGVKAFDSIGKEINPDMHEVITQIPSDTPGIIVEEFEKGYMLNDRILRVAKVIVGASL